MNQLLLLRQQKSQSWNCAALLCCVRVYLERAFQRSFEIEPPGKTTTTTQQAPFMNAWRIKEEPDAFFFANQQAIFGHDVGLKGWTLQALQIEFFVRHSSFKKRTTKNHYHQGSCKRWEKMVIATSYFFRIERTGIAWKKSWLRNRFKSWAIRFLGQTLLLLKLCRFPNLWRSG